MFYTCEGHILGEARKKVIFVTLDGRVLLLPHALFTEDIKVGVYGTFSFDAVAFARAINTETSKKCRIQLKVIDYDDVDEVYYINHECQSFVVPSSFFCPPQLIVIGQEKVYTCDYLTAKLFIKDIVCL